MRKLRIPLCLLLLLAPLFTCAFAQEYATVKSSGTTNVRSGPGTQYYKLGTVQKGEWVEILGEVNGFYHVYTLQGSVNGYIRKDLLTPAGSGVKTGVVKTAHASSLLSLRSYPSTAAQILGKYASGTVCTILDENYSSWYHVQVGGREGYFSAQYVSVQPVSGTSYWVYTKNGGNLNMRSAPADGSKIIASLKNDTEVTVLLKGTKYWQIYTKGMTGYVDSAYLAATPGSGSAPSGKSGWCVVNNASPTAYLNLRESASSTARSLAKYQNGKQLEVLFAGTEWTRVKDTQSGKTGYVMTKYIKLYNVSISRTVQNHSSYVNLRSRASKTSSSLARINSGTQVSVMIPGDTWCKVKYNGKVGYMMTYFLK